MVMNANFLSIYIPSYYNLYVKNKWNLKGDKDCKFFCSLKGGKDCKLFCNLEGGEEQAFL